MDARLLEAAQCGDINYLQQLLRENPLILDSIALLSTENLLNVALVTGNVSFVKEVIRLKPHFAKELNQDGFSPMHMAAANGHVEIVKELNEVNPNLCRLEGREQRTPLHYAAIKGRVEVISVLLGSCPECIDSVTVERETALHLAVKNNQFQATKTLVEWIRENNRDDVFNMIDEQGSTVLHLAIWKKQRQVIELLLDNRTSPGSLEVNAMNHYGLTALDVLLMSPSEAGDREIVEMLLDAEAMRGRDITLSNIPYNQTFTNSPTAPETDRSQLGGMVEYFKFKRGRDSPSTARSTLLVIVVLVATATFQVGVNPPGGVWQDTYTTGQNNNTSNIKPHNAGESVLGTTNLIAFDLFVFFNTVGFSVSLFMITILTSRFPLQFELQICLVAMYLHLK
ncbi:hypothetical protein P3X46_030732 [Hevea brasiliensis]|uniref:PGG domain-containing protein n=2 Tax=Hevea brasiliensis TaxID=3981 RepID=A0ABQ9KJN4_HEVBR|nr:hypothetical protein P3X46_030732 [Hevea brasiliensis]